MEIASDLRPVEPPRMGEPHAFARRCVEAVLAQLGEKREAFDGIVEARDDVFEGQRGDSEATVGLAGAMRSVARPGAAPSAASTSVTPGSRP